MRTSVEQEGPKETNGTNETNETNGASDTPPIVDKKPYDPFRCGNYTGQLALTDGEAFRKMIGAPAAQPQGVGGQLVPFRPYIPSLTIASKGRQTRPQVSMLIISTSIRETGAHSFLNLIGIVFDHESSGVKDFYPTNDMISFATCHIRKGEVFQAREQPGKKSTPGEDGKQKSGRQPPNLVVIDKYPSQVDASGMFELDIYWKKPPAAKQGEPAVEAPKPPEPGMIINLDRIHSKWTIEKQEDRVNAAAPSAGPSSTSLVSAGTVHDSAASGDQIPGYLQPRDKIDAPASSVVDQWETPKTEKNYLELKASGFSIRGPLDKKCTQETLQEAAQWGAPEGTSQYMVALIMAYVSRQPRVNSHSAYAAASTLGGFATYDFERHGADSLQNKMVKSLCDSRTSSLNATSAYVNKISSTFADETEKKYGSGMDMARESVSRFGARFEQHASSANPFLPLDVPYHPAVFTVRGLQYGSQFPIEINTMLGNGAYPVNTFTAMVPQQWIIAGPKNIVVPFIPIIISDVRAIIKAHNASGRGSDFSGYALGGFVFNHDGEMRPTMMGRTNMVELMGECGTGSVPQLMVLAEHLAPYATSIVALHVLPRAAETCAELDGPWIRSFQLNMHATLRRIAPIVSTEFAIKYLTVRGDGLFGRYDRQIRDLEARLKAEGKGKKTLTIADLEIVELKTSPQLASHGFCCTDAIAQSMAAMQEAASRHNSNLEFRLVLGSAAAMIVSGYENALTDTAEGQALIEELASFGAGDTDDSTEDCLAAGEEASLWESGDKAYRTMNDWFQTDKSSEDHSLVALAIFRAKTIRLAPAKIGKHTQYETCQRFGSAIKQLTTALLNRADDCSDLRETIAELMNESSPYLSAKKDIDIQSLLRDAVPYALLVPK